MKALVGKEFAQGTLDRYETCLRRTRSFLEWKYNVPDMDITKLNYEFFENYEFWLKTVRYCEHGATIKYLANFEKMIRLGGGMERWEFLDGQDTRASTPVIARGDH